MKDIFFKNLLCVIDTETTGLDPDQHEIVELAIIPVGLDIEPHPHHGPLDIWMRPDNIADVDPESLQITGTTLEEREKGLDAGLAADLLIKWFEDLCLPDKSKVIPIAHNWTFDSQFLRNWLGREAFDQIFHYHFRDTMLMCLTLDDMAWAYDDDLPFPRLGLRECCTTRGITVPPGAHGAMRDANLTRQLYKNLLFNRTLTRNQAKG